ncbi:MAG: thioredoxin [Oscillospiraceae bacterium]|nr:thioredoxin [Oscillospiraceae bacterium]
MSALELSSGNFDKTISSGCVLVDFWAEWCMPCKMVAPIVEELAEKYKDSVTVAKVNVDDENGLASRYGVMSIPTVILFKDGVETKRFVGVKPKQQYEQALEA